MELNCKIGNKVYQFDANVYHDISIPLKFNEKQPLNYGVNFASSKPLGSVEKGDACNFDQLELVPHCNGTHTECVGHISKENIAIQNELKDVLISAALITVNPEKIKEDLIITKNALSNAIGNLELHFLEALIVRTIPNSNEKLTKDYNQEIPPYFSFEAMQLINSLKVQHLLVDMPSVDRIYDEGKLSNHHAFWNVKQGTHHIDANTQNQKTITEMIFVPNIIEDGKYLLNLQIAPFLIDAAPSRPVLFPVKEKK